MQIIAEALDLDTLVYDVVMNNLFHPYVYVEQDTLFQTFNEGTFGYARTFGNGEYEDFLKVAQKLSGRPNITRDTWFFVIINTPMENPVVYAHNPLKNIFQKIDDDSNYCVIDNNKKSAKIKARDIYQKCAIYALKEAQHVLITGKWGTGKSLLATSAALANNDDKKIFVSRAPVGLNSKYNIGFTPGDVTEKMQDWLAGFMSALYYIFANTKGQDKAGGYDYVRDVLFREKMEPVPINTIQGLSLLDNDTLIVDEAQLIDISTISMILSRPSETGRLILLGDLGQTYDVVKPSESGLLKLLRVLPHKSMAYVDLQTSYRSDIIELADLLQDKTMG
jgi:PhoH-like ATPase